jgi:hypothetical protein
MQYPSIDYHGHRLGHLRFGPGYHAVYAPDTAAAPHTLPLAPETPLYRQSVGQPSAPGVHSEVIE